MSIPLEICGRDSFVLDSHVELPAQRGEVTTAIGPLLSNRNVCSHGGYRERSGLHLLGVSLRFVTPCGHGADRRYSGWMLAVRITLAHFSVSSAIIRPKSAGEPASVAPPVSPRRAFIVGSAKAALISPLSLPMISADVFA